MLAETHLLLDLPQVLSSPFRLLYVIDLHRSPIVHVPDVLLELGAVTDQFTFDSVDERAGPLVETISSAYLSKKPQIKKTIVVKNSNLRILLLTESMYSPQSSFDLITT